MLQTIPKWRVSVIFTGTTQVFWIHDLHIENVLRQVAAMQFRENGLEQPTQIIIGKSEFGVREG